jgi:hypothetical protein
MRRRKMEFKEIAQLVNSMTPIQINEELDKSVIKKDFDPLAIASKALSICYSREYCAALKIDYCSITKKDFDKARLVSYFMARNKR